MHDLFAPRLILHTHCDLFVGIIGNNQFPFTLKNTVFLQWNGFLTLLDVDVVLFIVVFTSERFNDLLHFLKALVIWGEGKDLIFSVPRRITWAHTVNYLLHVVPIATWSNMAAKISKLRNTRLTDDNHEIEGFESALNILINCFHSVEEARSWSIRRNKRLLTYF